MARVTSVVTIDTSEWVYIDSDGTAHPVTNAETFNLTIENTATNIKWQVLASQTMTTTDGYTITFRPSATVSNTAHSVELKALTDATLSYGIAGELRMSISTDNIEQIWKFAQFWTSDVDMGAAGTIGANTIATSCILEDQYINT